jgi:3-hydroxyisobutyrate dehydrogenase-like beta-hydroxyacid dehydrogenase
MDVGFIGVGSMGSAMVPNLVKAGHRVRVWNRSADAIKRLDGVTVAESPAAAFQTDVVMTMLSDDAAFRSVIVDSGALASARAQCVHVVMATISPTLVDEMQPIHRSAGIAYVAAPVFGVPAAAAKGELHIVVAGPAPAIAKVQPLLDVLGQRTWRLGEDPKRANVAKVAGNMMITVAIESMGEAAALTQSYGVAAGDFLEILTNSLFACPSYQRYGKKIATEDYDPGFKLVLGLKDVNLALDAAKATGVVLPAAEVVRDRMVDARARGWGDKDWSILAKARPR